MLLTLDESLDVLSMPEKYQETDTCGEDDTCGEVCRLGRAVEEPGGEGEDQADGDRCDGNGARHQVAQSPDQSREKSGRRALLLASNSLSHRHFTKEPELPEDMSHEHVYHHGQYIWDMRMLQLMRAGRTREMLDEMPDFIEQTVSECKEGSLSWLMGAMGLPDYPAEVYAYGSVIGTGNAVVCWDPERRT